MSIEYTYEITAVDEAARCMEVLYTSPGREPRLVGARLPYEGEDLEALIHSYSPVRYWEEQEAAVVVPQVGLKGTVTPVQPQVEAPGQIPQATP